MSDTIQPGVYQLGNDIQMLKLTDDLIVVSVSPELDLMRAASQLRDRMGGEGKRLIVVHGPLSYKTLGECEELRQVIKNVFVQVVSEGFLETI